VRLAACGLVLALSLTLSSPVLVPVSVGRNVTLIAHFSLVDKVVVQVVADSAKSPVVDILMPVKATGRSFIKVNVFAALVVPTFCLA
jgi:hypothetical protein